MTSPTPAASPDRQRHTPAPVVSRLTTEFQSEGPREPSPEIVEALERDKAELHREVILWQRWLRYALIVTLTLASAALADAQVAILPLLFVVGLYVAAVALSGWALGRDASLTRGPLLPALLVTVDLLAVGAIFYLTGPPQASARFLMIALLLVPVSAFYFGSGVAIYNAVLAAIVYALVGRVLPPMIPGEPSSIGINGGLFLLVAAALTYTFGRFHARMNELRLFCKMVEEGDLTGGLELTSAKYPDELTLLARSFEAMRSGLAEQIGTDALTGCLNRRALETRLKAEWRLARRRATHVAIAAIDLDHFKQINDTRGHPVGDIVLQQLAGIMKSTARDTDAVARFGGDEFVILLPDTGWQGALTFAERLRRRVDDFTFGPPGSPMTITISVGVALARGTDPFSPEELLKEADRSLYKAKQQGRNRVFA